ncbi:hypothetical protein GCM10011428_30660 [Streptomyces violaceus]
MAGSWVGAETAGDEPEARLRAAVAAAAYLHRIRGTRRGLSEAVRLAFGVEPEITESGGAAWSARPLGPFPGAPRPRLHVHLRLPAPTPADHYRLETLVSAARPAHMPYTVQVTRRCPRRKDPGDMTTPQNCADCGTRAEPGQSFCDACGAVLSWTDRPAGGTGPRAEAARPSEPAPASEPAVPPRASEPARAANGESGGSASSSPSPEPGWDAFARPDGGTGLARAPRDRLGTGTATQQASARAAATPEAAPRHPDHPGTPDDNTGSPHTHARPDTTAHPDTTPRSPSPTTPPPDETAPTEPIPPATQTPHPTDADADADTHGMTDRARSLLIPVGDPEPQPAPHPSVTPVLPGRPEPQRPQAVRAPGQEHGMDGGAPCPWCATRNRPERHFCARCAMPMAGDGPAGPARLPWWRRLGPFGSQEAPWAGDRPGCAVPSTVSCPGWASCSCCPC